MLTTDRVVQGNHKEMTTSHKQQIKRLLLVDDSPEDRSHIADCIHGAYETVLVEAVETGDDVMRSLEKETADCVILDYRLEVEDGLEVMSSIKKLYPHCPVIILTGEGDESVAATAIKAGAADYLVKNEISARLLCKTVDNAISRAELVRRVAEQDEERNHFLRTLVHDLRAPLRLINQYGALALEETNNGNLDDAKELVTQQSAIARRASALINSLESYTLLDREITFSLVSLSEVALQSNDNLLSEIADRNANITISELPTINGHEAQLMQLFQNLIQNALKYNQSEKPTVVIRTQETSENKVIIVVEDNGIGIEEESLERIFTPLQRIHTDRKYEGSGLGLSICKKVMRRHNGKIWCTSTVGEGTAFHMMFPVCF